MKTIFLLLILGLNNGPLSSKDSNGIGNDEIQSKKQKQEIVCENNNLFLLDSIYNYMGVNNEWALDNRYRVHERNEFGLQLYGITDFYNSLDKRYYNKYDFTVEYHSEEQRKSSLRRVWDKVNLVWLEEQYFSYEPDGVYNERFIKYWNFEMNKFTGGYRYIYEINEEGSYDNYFKQSWHVQYESWMENWQYVNLFNSNNVLTGDSILSYDAGSSSWKNERKDIFVRDGAERLITQTVQYWGSDKEWYNAFLFNYKYDLDGNQTEKTSYNWSFDQSSWIANRKNASGYNTWLTKDYEIEFVYSSEISDWVNERKTEYFYNTLGDIKEELLSKWDLIDQKWIPQEREVLKYGSTGQLTIRISQIWDDNNSKWINISKIQYFYNWLGYKTSEQHFTWNPSEMQWIENKRSDYFYSFNNYKYDVKHIPICHKGKTLYLPINAVRAHLHHGDCLGECTVEGNLSVNKRKKSQIDKPESGNSFSVPIIYPNPATDYFTVDLNGNNDAYNHIELINISGVVVRQLELNGQSLVKLQCRNLQKGAYFIRLSGTQNKTLKLMLK